MLEFRKKILHARTFFGDREDSRCAIPGSEHTSMKDRDVDGGLRLCSAICGSSAHLSSLPEITVLMLQLQAVFPRLVL
jgi:hypothetical protein